MMLRAADSRRQPLPLRDYQRDDLLDLHEGWMRHTRGEGSEIGYEAPMGSGKTTTVRALAAWLLHHDSLRLVVVAAPLDAIVQQWAPPRHFADPHIDRGQRGGTIVRIPREGQAWDNAPRATSAQLADPTWWAETSGFYVCSRQAMCTEQAHAALAASRVKLSDVLAVGDEGHHHGDGTWAGQVFAALRARGAATLLVSGTPWHGDGSIFTAKTHVVRRSAASLLVYFDSATGKPYVPQHWRPQRVLVSDLKTDRVDHVVEQDRETKPVHFTTTYVRRMCAAIATHWAAEGCPRVIVNLPYVTWREPMTKALRLAGAPVLARPAVLVDLVGDLTDAERSTRQGQLAADAASRTWDGPHRVDAVLSVARMDEGTDWPQCSAVYNVRIPTSPLRILQRWARAGRGKWEIAGYPEKWADEMRMVFFVPQLEGQAVEDVWRQHREQAILLAAFVADHEEARRWIAPSTAAWARASRRHAEGRKSKRGERLRPDTSRTGDVDPRAGDQIGRARTVAALIKLIARQGAKATKRIAELDAELERVLPDVSASIRKAALLHLARGLDVEAAVAAAQEKAAGEMTGRNLKTVRAELEADLARIVAEFAHLELPVPDEWMTRIADFTAHDAKQVAERMRGLNQSPWYGMNLTQMTTFFRGAAKRYTIRTGKRPTTAAAAAAAAAFGTCVELDDYTWRGADTALAAYGTHLTDVLGRPFPKYEKNAIDIRTFYDEHGRWPSRVTNDSNEKRLGKALSRIRAKAPAICSKYDILLRDNHSDVARRARGKRQFCTLAELLIQCICHGSPTRTKSIGTSIGTETGRSIDAILWQCGKEPSKSRGLAYAPDRCQVSSLAKLMAEVRSDCWRFTLADATAPDSRPWAELLASGDHVRIVSAERIAYLDWQDKRLRGGARWMNTVPHSRLSDAVKRTWTSFVST